MNRRTFLELSALGTVIDAERKGHRGFEGSPAIPRDLESGKSAVTALCIQGVRDLGWYSVRDPAFGAKGNDTDDTQAFQAAIDASPPGGTIYVPPADLGKAYLLSNLTIKKPLTLLGAPGFGSVLKAKPRATGYMLNISGFSAGATLGAEGHLQRVLVQGLRFDGNSRQPSYGAIRCGALEQSTVQDLILESFSQEALDLFSSVRECVFRNIHMRCCGDKDTNTPAINLYDRSAVSTGPGTDAHNLLYFDQIFSIFPYGDHFLFDTMAGKPKFWVRDIQISNSVLHGTIPGVNYIGNPVPTAGQQACRHFVVKGTSGLTLSNVTSVATGIGVPFVAVLPSAGARQADGLLISGYSAAGRYAYVGEQTGIDLAVGDLTLEHSHITGNRTAAIRTAVGTTVRLGDGNDFGSDPVVINGFSKSRFYGIVTLDGAKFNAVSTGSGTPALGKNCPAATPSGPYTWLKVLSSDNSVVYIPCWK